MTLLDQARPRPRIWTLRRVDYLAARSRSSAGRSWTGTRSCRGGRRPHHGRARGRDARRGEQRCFYAGKPAEMLAAPTGMGERSPRRVDQDRFLATTSSGMANVLGGDGQGEDGVAEASRSQTSRRSRRRPAAASVAGDRAVLPARSRNGRELLDRVSSRRAQRPSECCRRAALGRARPGDDRSVACRRGELRRGDPALERDGPEDRARRARRPRLAAGPSGAGGGMPPARQRSQGPMRGARNRPLRRLGRASARRPRAHSGSRRGDRRTSSDHRRCEALRIADVDLSPAPELVEAYLRLGRRDEAEVAARRVRGPGPGEGATVGSRRAAWSGLLRRDDA